MKPTGETLTGLSADIATLTGIIGEAEGRGRIHLARLLTQARAAKVAEAREAMAHAKASVATVVAGDRNLRAPVDDLTLKPEVRQWQRAVNEGWNQDV